MSEERTVLGVVQPCLDSLNPGERHGVDRMDLMSDRIESPPPQSPFYHVHIAGGSASSRSDPCDASLVRHITGRMGKMLDQGLVYVRRGVLPMWYTNNTSKTGQSGRRRCNACHPSVGPHWVSVVFRLCCFSRVDRDHLHCFALAGRRLWRRPDCVTYRDGKCWLP